MPDDEEEINLIERILEGQEHLYAILVDRYKRFALTLATRIVSSPEEAEEATQDAFVKAYQHLASFQRQARFSTWLYRIVCNTAISYKRKEKKHLFAPESPTIPSTYAHHEMEQNDQQKFIRLAMNKLKDLDRLLLTLYYLQEFSQEEIAEISGLTANTVKVRLHRARLRLADELHAILKKEALTL